MGIYVHIPFCRSKCFYCGFYSVASTVLKDAYVDALCREIELRADYLPDRRSETLYFGGGTPSFLEISDLEKIIAKLTTTYQFTPDAEWTIELNPEDMTIEKLTGIKSLGFNRLSVGVQSFSDDVLKQINRTHSAEQAVNAVKLAQSLGFDNIGIDLIIGLPGTQNKNIDHDLSVVKPLLLNHLSVYILSIDSNSVFENLRNKGNLEIKDDDRLAEEYEKVSGCFREMGFEHYEISNFARNGKYSRHNTSYWQQKPYIGLGASAHSYDGISRQWNISNLKTYINSINNSMLKFDREELSETDKYNEYLMTNLRTMWGVDLTFLEEKYGKFLFCSQKCIENYLQNGYMKQVGRRLRLTEKGWLISDRIFSDLFIV